MVASGVRFADVLEASERRGYRPHHDHTRPARSTDSIPTGLEGYEPDVEEAESDGIALLEEDSEPPAVARLQAKVASLHRVPSWVKYILSRALSASCRLELETDIRISLRRFRAYTWTRQDKVKYTMMATVSLFSLYVMQCPGFPLKLLIPVLYTLAILVPVTSQFFLPASPIFAWLILFYSAQFIPPRERPHIWVSLLPTLERAWYGANISEIITRLGHPVLDIFAWIPYGIVHFSAPFFVAAFLFILGPPGSIKFFAVAFGFLNMIGVAVQVVLPCVPPWYEVRDGLTPATHDMKGSPAGLARIDKLFGGHGYTRAFTNAPVPFGAFPSLHAGCATMEALMLSYFFPVGVTIYHSAKRQIRLDMRLVYWMYAGWLYWCTMYLMHHFLIDLVAGGCLATASFYAYLTDDIRDAMELHWFAHRSSSPAPLSAAPGARRPSSGFGVRRNGRVVRPTDTEWNGIQDPEALRDTEVATYKHSNAPFQLASPKSSEAMELLPVGKHHELAPEHDRLSNLVHVGTENQYTPPQSGTPTPKSPIK